MNVIAYRTLRAYSEKNASAKTPLDAWHKEMKRASFKNFNELRAQFPSADYVPDGEFTIFNIGGNNYRLAASVHYPTGIVFIRRIMTHAEYDKGAWRNDF